MSHTAPITSSDLLPLSALHPSQAPSFARGLPYPPPSTSQKPRVTFDSPPLHANISSAHWSALEHLCADVTLRSLDELRDRLTADLTGDGGGAVPPLLLAVWSAVFGYCEAVCTHADAGRRHRLFPVPYGALRRAVDGEFVPALRRLRLDPGRHAHRDAVRSVSGLLWSGAGRNSGREEKHANSLYAWLRGSVDGKGLDCFGSAISCVAGLGILGFGSFLALSEDHAYEMHVVPPEDGGPSAPPRYATCEMAVPGNTKQAREKRGREIAETLRTGTSNLTPGTSWLYMAEHPVLCNTVGMSIAAAAGNINALIESRGGCSVVSAELYDVKREALWALHALGYLDAFPFALIELGECEEQRPSARGSEAAPAPELGPGALVLRNERLFLDAMAVSRARYGDAQAYPYLYAGHYHKDAGCRGGSEEYRLAEALRLYSEAGRVAGTYVYDARDSLHLMQQFTAVADLIVKDVLTAVGSAAPRAWERPGDAVAAATWLLAFFDHLLSWEEKCGGSRFVEILGPAHKHSVGKMFQHFSFEVRAKAMRSIFFGEGVGAERDHASPVITRDDVVCFKGPIVSRRMAEGGPLAAALGREKVTVREMELAVTIPEGGRRAKRVRRSG